MKRNELVRMVGMSAVLAICFWVSLGSRVPADTPKTETGKTPAAEASEEIVHQPNLTYRTVNGKALQLDLVCPKLGAGPFPAVVLVHGTGPFTKGRIGMIPLAQELARNGYVAIAVSYRYRPEDKFPAPIQDVSCAIRWVRDRSVQYKVDKDRIGVVGFSGGGTLACLLGMKGGQDNLPDKGKDATQASPLRAIVSFYGPMDFARLHEDCQKKVKQGSPAEKLQGNLIMKTLEKWLGGPPSKVRELYDEASPLKQVAKDSPPILLIHGADDSIVPVEQPRLFAKRLQKSGRPVSLLVVESAGHDFEEKNRTDGRMVFAAVMAFLEEHLQGNIEAKPLGKKADK